MDKANMAGGTATVSPAMVGEGGSTVRPGSDPGMFGDVALEPVRPVEVRSYQTFVLTYTVGALGLDDTGSICVCFRVMSDFGPLQVDKPARPNYVSAWSSGGGHIWMHYDPDGGQRPWNKRLVARLDGGYLSPGETITIVLGDTRGGSPGWAMQTFAEAGFELRVLVDAVATRHYHPLPRQLAIPVVAGPVDRWKAVIPTLRRPAETFQLGIKAEDRWGNPTAQAVAKLRLEPSLPVTSLPETVAFGPSERSVCVEGLSVREEGTLRIRVMAGDELVAEAGPLVVRSGDAAGYWADMHGQSGETVGINRAEHYFDFARNLSFLDATSHQGNDFQINSAFWSELNRITARYDEPGRFVALPGYEWSGNTAVGGDHNVFFRNEGRPIRRSSHALLSDRDDLATDANDLRALYASLAEEDCVIYAHVGGRYANIGYAHDPKLETAVELHSAWGTFEWMLADAFELGYRVGVVCNSDGHKGRPGASYPGAATFGSYGGLTCFLADRLDRDAIMEAMRRRHHYGTTGVRMHLDVRAEWAGRGVVYERDPDAFPGAAFRTADAAIMGDIARIGAGKVRVKVSIEAAAPIERVEIRNGAEARVVVRPFARSDLGARIRVIWSGAEYRGRGRNTLWRGRARFIGGRIVDFARINAWNHERLFERRGSDQVVWESITTGNFMGFDVWLEDGNAGELEITTNHGNMTVPIASVGIEDHMMEAGGLGRRLRAVRLPERNPHRMMEVDTEIDLDCGGDNPIWVCVTTEDGHQAWSSPIYFIR